MFVCQILIIFKTTVNPEIEDPTNRPIIISMYVNSSTQNLNNITCFMHNYKKKTFVHCSLSDVLLSVLSDEDVWIQVRSDIQAGAGSVLLTEAGGF